MRPGRAVSLETGSEVRGRTVTGRLPGTSRGVHSDVEARRAGMPAGIVVNEFHFSQLSDLLLECFGDRWLTTGEIEVRYVRPLYDGEQLTPAFRVTAQQPRDDAVELDVWCENQDGTRLSVGEARCRRPGPAG